MRSLEFLVETSHAVSVAVLLELFLPPDVDCTATAVSAFFFFEGINCICLAQDEDP